MHPFSLTNEEIAQVSGGFTFPGDGTVSSMMYGEEGGQPPIDPPFYSMNSSEDGSYPLPVDTVTSVAQP